MKSRMTLLAIATIVVGLLSMSVAGAVTIAKPASLTATATSSSAVTLKWADKSTNEIGFEIQRSLAAKTSWKKIATAATNAATFGDSNLLASTAYKYRIRALKPGSGASSYSNTATVTTLVGTTTPPPDTTAPTLPGGLTVTATSCSATQLTWSASTDTGGSGVKDYAIWRDGVFVKYVTTLTTLDAGLTASHTYGYAVQARDNALNLSGKTATHSITTPACTTTTIPAPGGLKVTSDSCAFALATWTPIFDPNNSYHLTKYNLYRNNALVKTVATPTSTVLDSSLAAVTTYSYAITAADASNNESAKSASVSVTTATCPPANAWAKTAGGAGSEVGQTVAVDGQGNTIIGGTFRQTADFGDGPVVASANGDMFIAAYSPAHTYMWAKHFASSQYSNELNGIATDAAGNVYLAGAFFGTLDFTPEVTTDGNLFTPYAGYRDAFTAKFSAAGDYLWSQSFGQGKDDSATSVAIDTNQNPVFAGFFWGNNVNFGGGFLFTDGPGTNPDIWRFSGSDTFVLHVNPSDGTTAQAFQTKCGGLFAHDVALDSANNVVLTGYLQAACPSMFAAGPKNYAAFVAKFSAAGQFSWGKLFDGDSNYADYGNAVAVDASGNVFATGTFTGAINFGDATRGQAGGWAGWGYLVKLTAGSGALQWSKAYGSSDPLVYGIVYGYGVTADVHGNVTVVGSFGGTIDFGGGPLYGGTKNGSYGFAAFVAEYSPTGAYLASNRYGNGTNTQGFGVTNGATGAVVVGSFTDTVDFGFGPVTSAGFNDLFILNTGR